MNKIKTFGNLVVGSTLSFLFVTQSVAIERPFIWMTAREKAQIIQKIERHAWAKSRFNTLKKRTDEYAPASYKQRIANVTKLPLQWESEAERFPPFIDQPNIGVMHLREPLQLSLQGAIDCGILYNFTKQEKYAHCAADILHTVVQGLNSTPLLKEQVQLDNRSWVVSRNHLLESRIYGAQIPLIYDFIYNYLKAGGKVYDAHKEQLVDFDFAAAQHVFETYAQLALDSGLVNNNWPVLESTSLVHNALALDDDKKRSYYLEHYLSKNTANQDSLAKVAKSYVNRGDIWPESLNYSMHVAYFSLYLMDLIDRLQPELKLGNKYPNIASALLTYEQLRFPNGDYPAFGDGNRSYKDNYFEFELAYKSAVMNGNEALQKTFANEIKHAMKSGKYDRSKLLPRHTKAKPYYAPLELLWAEADLGSQESHATFNAFTTVDIPFAGVFIQRNLNTQDPQKNGLMATVGGGSYVHGHASGIDLELYGQGYVLGIDAGKGPYPSDTHQNYRRLFAGHNTVISNGASASKGDWIDLGINRVEKVRMEPESRTKPVSDKYSFVTTSFHDEFNLAKEAFHERTTAVIRLSDSVGYYLDLFRAKSDTADQYHDYLYRNLADSLEVTANGKALAFQEDEKRYQPYDPKAISRWSHDKNYAHPGWHFFSGVKTSHNTEQTVRATFKGNAFKPLPIFMQANVVQGLDVTVTQAMVPGSKIELAPYKKKPHPIMVLRHKGEAWSNPFVVTYESYQGNELPSIKSTSRLMEGGKFKGVKVIANVDGHRVEQYVLVQESMADTYTLSSEGISFTGAFGIITLTDGKLSDLYIGQGSQISFQGHQLLASPSAYRAF